MQFQEEAVSTCWDELYPLAYQHHQSSQNYKRHEPFRPLRERYERYHDAGIFRLLTARDNGRLVGYFGVYLLESMHSQLPLLREDTFYLDPAYRGGRNALRFLTFIEGCFRRECPIEILFSCEEDNNSGIKKLLQHMDYTPVILVWSKFLSPCADSAPSNQMEVAHVGDSVLRT